MSLPRPTSSDALEASTPLDAIHRRFSRMRRHESHFETAEGRTSFELALDASEPLDGELIDLGCGSGRLLRFLRERTEFMQYVGVDRVAEAIATAKSTYMNEVATFVHADLHQLPFPNASFDAAIAHMVFAQVRNPTAVLNEVRRVLRPNGRFVMVTPATWRSMTSPSIQAFRELVEIYSRFPQSHPLPYRNNQLGTRELIEGMIGDIFGCGYRIEYIDFNYCIHMPAVEALGVFTVSMYDFDRIHREFKPQAVGEFLSALLNLEGPDGCVHLERPMMLVRVTQEIQQCR